MATFTDVFERKEVKYRLSAQQHCFMLEALAGRMAPDEYGRTRITSLYLDTPDRLLIDRSLEKPLYKEKLRLRWYGVAQKDDRVYIEIKKKHKGVVYKRRVGCSYTAAQAYLAGMPYQQACARYPMADPLMNEEATAPRSLQIADEIDQFALRYRTLAPSMLIACDRTAYAPVDLLMGDAGVAAAAALGAGAAQTGPAADLRITFDADIAYSDVLSAATACSNGEASQSLLAAGEAVMEIKAAGPFPLWLVHALDACQAYPTSFSKYGEAYRRCAAGKGGAPKTPPVPERAAEWAGRSVRAPWHGVSDDAREGSRAHRPGGRATRAASVQAGERLATTAQGLAQRSYRAPKHAVKKGGRCA